MCASSLFYSINIHVAYLYIIKNNAAPLLHVQGLFPYEPLFQGASSIPSEAIFSQYLRNEPEPPQTLLETYYESCITLRNLEEGTKSLQIESM